MLWYGGIFRLRAGTLRYFSHRWRAKTVTRRTRTRAKHDCCRTRILLSAPNSPLHWCRCTVPHGATGIAADQVTCENELTRMRWSACEIWLVRKKMSRRGQTHTSPTPERGTVLAVVSELSPSLALRASVTCFSERAIQEPIASSSVIDTFANFIKLTVHHRAIALVIRARIRGVRI